MEMKNSEVLELIFKSKKSIEKIQNTNEDKKEIKKLAKKISNLVDKMNRDIKTEEQNLEIYRNRLYEIEKEESKENTITIRNIIKSNLPKNIIAKEDGDKLNLCIKEVIPPKRIAEEIVIGCVHINVDYVDRIDVNVYITLKENKREEKFSISKENPLRIYKIISYIHDNLSYNE